MVITPDLEYPIVCVNVRKGFDGKSLKLDMVNLNSTASWFNSDSSTGFGLETGGTAGPMDGYATVIPRHELMNVQAVVQLEKDTILVCYDSKIILYLTNSSLKPTTNLKFKILKDCFVYINKYLVLDTVKVVNLQGKLKSSKRQASELHFDFSINNIGKVGTAVLLNVTLAFTNLSGKSYKKKCLILLIFFQLY